MKEKIAILGYGNIGKSVYKNLCSFLGKEKIVLINDVEVKDQHIENILTLNVKKDIEKFTNFIKNNVFLGIGSGKPLISMRGSSPIVELFLNNKIRRKGFVKQEDINFDDISKTSFFKKIKFIYPTVI